MFPTPYTAIRAEKCVDCEFFVCIFALNSCEFRRFYLLPKTGVFIFRQKPSTAVVPGDMRVFLNKTRKNLAVFSPMTLFFMENVGKRCFSRHEDLFFC